MPLYQRSQIEFVFGVEAARKRCSFLIEHAVGADDALVLGTTQGVIENQNVIAHGVEAICVATVECLQVARFGAKLLVKDAIANLLRRQNFRRVARQPHFQRANAAKRWLGSIWH